MRIIDEIIARALMNDAARFQHIGTIGAPERELCDQQEWQCSPEAVLGRLMRLGRRALETPNLCWP
jgi:hypothetical protein